MLNCLTRTQAPAWVRPALEAPASTLPNSHVFHRAIVTPLPLEISCSEVQTWRTENQDFVLVDCREPAEHTLVAISGSQLLPMSQLPQRYQELSGQEDQRLVVYCHHGQRSAQVTAWLRQQGFSQAQSMAGGIDAWAVQIEEGMQRY